MRCREKREAERKTGGLSFGMATGGKSSVDRKVKGAGPETNCVRNPARRKGLRGNAVSLTSKPVFPRYGEIRREGFRRNRRQTLYLHMNQVPADVTIYNTEWHFLEATV